MTEAINTPNRQLTEEISHSDRILFHFGTPAYNRMASMIQKMANAKTEDQNHFEQRRQQSGQNESNAIQLESPVQQEEETDVKSKTGEDVKPSPGEWVFEEQNEAQEEKGEGQMDEQQEQQSASEQEEDFRPSAPKTIPKRQIKPELSRINKDTRKSPIVKTNIKIKPRVSTRAKIQQMKMKRRSRQQRKSPIVYSPPSKVKPKSPISKPPMPKQLKLLSSSPPRPISKKKAVKQSERYEEGRIVIRIESEDLSLEDIKILRRPKITKKALKEEQQEKKRNSISSKTNTNTYKANNNACKTNADTCKNNTKTCESKLKKPQIQWLDFRIVLPLTTRTTSKHSEPTSQKSLPFQAKTAVKQQFTAKMLLSKSIEMEAEMNMQKNIDKTIKKPEEKINLGTYSLLELVELIFNHSLISDQLYKEFSQSHSILYTQDFLQKFEAGKLRRFNFKTIQFTPLDHRRLSELLVNLYPTRYTLDHACLPEDESCDFIRSSYGLTPKEYFDMYSRIDKISDIGWWSEIITRQKERIQEAVLRRKESTETEANKSESVKGNLREQSKVQDAPRKRVKFV